MCSGRSPGLCSQPKPCLPRLWVPPLILPPLLLVLLCRYMVPAQLAVVYHHWRANADSCAATVLAAPSAVARTHTVARALAGLQVSSRSGGASFGTLLQVGVLQAVEQCAAGC